MAGQLAVFRLGRFVRKQILHDPTPPRKLVPLLDDVIHRQGDLLLTKRQELLLHNKSLNRSN